MIKITKIHRTIICPGLNFILLLYSSKYLTNPPIPCGIEILSLAMLLKKYRVGISHLLSGPKAKLVCTMPCLSIKLSVTGITQFLAKLRFTELAPARAHRFILPAKTSAFEASHFIAEVRFWVVAFCLQNLVSQVALPCIYAKHGFLHDGGWTFLNKWIPKLSANPIRCRRQNIYKKVSVSPRPFLRRKALENLRIFCATRSVSLARPKETTPRPARFFASQNRTFFNSHIA